MERYHLSFIHRLPARWSGLTLTIIVIKKFVNGYSPFDIPDDTQKT